MQGMITIMIILIFIPVVFAIYILYKRMHEEPKDNKSREILLQAMCFEELRKKKGEDTASDNQRSEEITDEHKELSGQGSDITDHKQETKQIDEDTRKAIMIAKQTLYSQEHQNKKEEENDSKKKAAAEVVMKMMKNKGSYGASREELQEMINVLSDKKK